MHSDAPFELRPPGSPDPTVHILTNKGAAWAKVGLPGERFWCKIESVDGDGMVQMTIDNTLRASTLRAGDRIALPRNCNHFFPEFNHFFPSSIHYSFCCIHIHLHSSAFIDLISLHSSSIRPITNIPPHSRTFIASVARCTTSSAFSSHSRKKIHLHWSRSTLYHINMHSAYAHLFAFTERMVNAI